MSLAVALEEGVAAAGWTVPEDIQQKLLAYLALLQKWNKVHNLTAIRDPQEMVRLHLLDSLSVLPHVQALAPPSLLDVGSGAGFPGIVLALCIPGMQVTTIDAVQKKASFMRQAKAELQIDNLTVMSGRVEDYRPNSPFNIVISRAFSELAMFLRLTRHLIAEDGLWLAMKGAVPEDELQKLTIHPIRIIPLQVPGLEAQRHLIMIPARADDSSNSISVNKTA